MSSTIEMENTLMLLDPSSVCKACLSFLALLVYYKFLVFPIRLAYILRLSQLKNYVTVPAWISTNFTQLETSISCLAQGLSLDRRMPGTKSGFKGANSDFNLISFLLCAGPWSSRGFGLVSS